MYSRDEKFLCSLECYCGIYFFATWENTKITLPWALKQFVTRVHALLLFSHDRPWTSPWIKSISNASQLSGHCDVIINRLWRHQQNESTASETRGQCVKIVVFIVIYGFVLSNKCVQDNSATIDVINKTIQIHVITQTEKGHKWMSRVQFIFQ